MKAVLFPGQGSQFRGMGKDLFELYPDLTQRASEILGYDIQELCLSDPENKLLLTQYTQPALYTVNALNWFEEVYAGVAANVDFFLGHSLGEYNALLAAEVFDFETGLRLVKKRGELMGAASDGGMIAVLGMNAEDIENFLKQQHLEGIDLANYNTSSQVVVAGQSAAIKEAYAAFQKHAINAVLLKVSAPFHSRYMRPAEAAFADFLKDVTFSAFRTPVIANITARPYENHNLPATLSRQIARAVLWRDSIRYLLGQDREMEFQEIGGTVLSKMVKVIQEKDTPLIVPEEPEVSPIHFPQNSEAVPAAPITTLRQTSNGEKVKLFCIAYAGGDARSYRSLEEYLEQICIVPLERPGHGRRTAEPLLTDVTAMVDDLFKQIQSQLHGPYAIYGHSLGARLSFLLCQRLRHEKQPMPIHLFVSGEAAPSLPSKEKDTWRLPVEAFWQHLKEMEGSPDELFQIPDLLTFFEPVIRSDFQALSTFTYQKEAPFNLPITVMIGNQENVSIAEAKGWQQETICPMTLCVLPGAHFFFKQHWSSMAKLIESSLEEPALAM